MTAHASHSPLPIPADEPDSKIWTRENDDKLISARQKGLNWKPIADQYFPNKSANACRKRHERLMEKRKSNDSWDEPKMEEMAQAYFDLREQMWQTLAERVGDKWQNVEAKCMEKGLKNLSTANRNYSRRRQNQLSGSDVDEQTQSPYLLNRGRSGSHQNESDERFNDSGLGPEPENPYYHSNNDHQQPYTSGIHTEPAQYTTGVITPSTSSRSYSVSSSTGGTYHSTNLLNNSPSYQPFHPPSSFSQPQTTLPSFSTTFGPPSIPTPNRR